MFAANAKQGTCRKPISFLPPPVIMVVVGGTCDGSSFCVSNSTERQTVMFDLDMFSLFWDPTGPACLSKASMADAKVVIFFRSIGGTASERSRVKSTSQCFNKNLG